MIRIRDTVICRQSIRRVSALQRRSSADGLRRGRIIPVHEHAGMTDMAGVVPIQGGFVRTCRKLRHQQQ